MTIVMTRQINIINESGYKIWRNTNRRIKIPDRIKNAGLILITLQFKYLYFIFAAALRFTDVHSAFTAIILFRAIKFDGLNTTHAIVQVNNNPATHCKIYQHWYGGYDLFHRGSKDNINHQTFTPDFYHIVRCSKNC